MLNKLDATPISNFQPIDQITFPDCWYKLTYLMANSADPGSGSTLFAKAGYIRVQQDTFTSAIKSLLKTVR